VAPGEGPEFKAPVLKKKKEQIESDSHVPREVYSWNGELIKYEENLLIKLYY
jgi:hypothetical protein